VNIVTLNWQTPLWEGDQEVVKRSGRDEPIWVVKHMCMETTQGTSLYSYLHLKLAKMPCFKKLSLMFSPQKKSENKMAEQVLPGSGRGGGAGSK
jgi:hypothetical protein